MTKTWVVLAQVGAPESRQVCQSVSIDQIYKFPIKIRAKMLQIQGRGKVANLVEGRSGLIYRDKDWPLLPQVRLPDKICSYR